MNTPLVLLSTALLLTSASTVFAASSVDLTVKGLITPSACSPSLPGGQVVDYGKISAKDLKQDHWTGLGKQTLQLAITCDGPTLVALRGIDNQGNSPDPRNSYGLALVGDKKLGDYILVLSNVRADGAAPSVLESSDDGLTWQEHVPGDVWPVTSLASFGNRSTGSPAPIPIEQVTADLGVSTNIAPTAGMDLTNEVLINGSATIEVKYL